MADDGNRHSQLIISVNGVCYLFVFTLLSFFIITGEGKIVRVAVPSSAYYDLAETIKSETETRNKFRFEVLPSLSSEDEINARDSLYRFLQKRRIKMVLGFYTKTVAVVTEKLEIPYIVTSFGIMAPERNVLQVVPSLNDIVSCVLDIIEAYRWTQIGLFCDEAILHPRLLSEMVRNPAIDVRLLQVPPGPVNDTKVKEDLMTLRDLGVLEVLLFTPVSTSKIILETTKYLGMFAKPYSWLMLNLGSQLHLEEMMTDLLTNMTTINLVLPSPSMSTLGRESKDKYPILEGAIVSDSIMLMDNLAGLKKKKSKTIKKPVYQGHTGNLQFGENGLRNNFSFAVFNSENDMMEQSGEWWTVENKHKLFMYPRTGHLQMDEDSLNGKTVNVVSVLEKPWLMLKDEPDLNGNMFEGYSYDLMAELSRVLNFKFNMYLVSDGKYGVRYPSGEWDGIIGELVAKNATLSIGPLGIDGARAAAVDFTVPFMHRGVTVLIRSPVIENSFFKFMRPLSTNVWLAALAALVLFSVVLGIVERGGKAWRTDLPRLDNLVESWWFILGAIACGNTESSPVTVSGRVLSSAWWFFSLILISTYTANLAAFLTVNIINPPISGVEDLLGQTQIKYGTVRNSVVQVFFQNATIPPYSLLNSQMALIDSNVNSTTEGLIKVQEGDYAFLWDASINGYTALTDCNFTNIGPAFDIRGFGVGLPQGTPFKDDISLAILKLGDDGTLSQLEYKWWGNSRCPDLSQPSRTPSSSPAINTENVAGIFFILAGGVLLALLCLICEKVMQAAKSCTNAKEETVD